MSIRAKLFCNSYEDRESLRYAALILLDGICDEVEMIYDENMECCLRINDDLRISEEELRRIFNSVTLDYETISGRRDRQGRFDESKLSWAIKHPWISERSLELREELERRGAILNREKRKFRVVFTHDIDWTTGMTMFSVLKSLMQLPKQERRKWLTFRKVWKKDLLIENIKKILRIEQQYGLRSWNLLLADEGRYRRYSARYDISWQTSRRYIEAINKAGSYVGLHGSYYARERGSYLMEAERLREAVGRPITAHRNHYLRFDPVKVWDQLENAGIMYDFSIGFISKIGFRAGLAKPYHPYDLLNRRISSIVEIPLVYMERENHLNNQEKTLEELEDVLKSAKVVNGCVSILFHPESFQIDERWFNFYRKVIEMCIDLSADISGELPTKDQIRYQREYSN